MVCCVLLFTFGPCNKFCSIICKTCSGIGVNSWVGSQLVDSSAQSRVTRAVCIWCKYSVLGTVLKHLMHFYWLLLLQQTYHEVYYLPSFIKRIKLFVQGWIGNNWQSQDSYQGLSDFRNSILNHSIFLPWKYCFRHAVWAEVRSHGIVTCGVEEPVAVVQSLSRVPLFCNPISFSRRSSRPRDRTRVSFIGRGILYTVK